MTALESVRRLGVPPRPRRGRTVTTWIVVVVAVVAVHALAFEQTKFSFVELFKGWHGIWAFLVGDERTKGALPPDLHWSINGGRDGIGPGLRQCLVTFSMGLLGTTFSVPLALVLALLGSRTTCHNPFVYQCARALMSFFRAVPSFVFGLVFVTAVGLGTFPGVLAIIVHNMGVMGKLWSEAMEEIDEGPVEALRSAGASSAQTATHVVLPSVLPQFISLFLYRVDVNTRDSLVLGIVGAGGLGFILTNAVQEFDFPLMMTYVLMVLIMVVALDQLSAWLRRRVAR